MLISYVVTFTVRLQHITNKDLSFICNKEEDHMMEIYLMLWNLMRKKFSISVVQLAWMQLSCSLYDTKLPIWWSSSVSLTDPSHSGEVRNILGHILVNYPCNNTA